MHPSRPHLVIEDRPHPSAGMPTGEQLSERPAAVIRRALLATVMLAIVLALGGGGSARAQDGGVDPLAGPVAPKAPVICTNQTYALCAGAKCFVYNDVAYCTCDVEQGKSISSPLNYHGGNICSLNEGGVNNGYMASTFSLPKELRAPLGHEALYQCDRTFYTAYAKCDGGICFTSTTGNSFPGSKAPLGDKRIVCSCPVEREDPVKGLEIIGPYPCQASFFKYCSRLTTNNGSSLYDGTAIGATVDATRRLYGSVPLLNECSEKP